VADERTPAYDATIAYLSALEVSAGWDLKLDRMQAALARRGHPEARWPAVHVAGTNGKGSTAAMLDAVLRAAGWRTGLYTSPHLVDFTERIRVGGRTIPRATVVERVARLRTELDAAGIALTHFEFATLLAFEWFADVGIDVGVIEVGLGGRLDATNLVCPVATAITSIGIDHVEYLGHDVAAIAGEKAGILKPGVPLALGAVPPEAERVIRARAAAVGAPVLRAGTDAVLEGADGGLVFRGPGARWDGLRLGLRGAFQRANATVALLALAAARDRFPCPVAAVRDGLADVRWPGRLAVVGDRPLLVLDGAHNADGIATLVRELPAVVRGRPVDLVFAVMADKDWTAMLAPLLPCVRRAVVTRVGRRGAVPAAIAAAVAGRVPVDAVDDPRAALGVALARAEADAAVLVTGSLFLVGEAYAELERRGDAARLFQPWNGPGSGGTQATA
jgi:dihydrofolate synthase/folylpolyglutamate synthase